VREIEISMKFRASGGSIFGKEEAIWQFLVVWLCGVVLGAMVLLWVGWLTSFPGSGAQVFCCRAIAGSDETIGSERQGLEIIVSHRGSELLIPWRAMAQVAEQAIV